MNEELMKEGLKLISTILNNRLISNPLTQIELTMVEEYKNTYGPIDRCTVHPFPDLVYCKACKGIGTTLTD